jgi:hypothetical protein
MPQDTKGGHDDEDSDDIAKDMHMTSLPVEACNLPLRGPSNASA